MVAVDGGNCWVEVGQWQKKKKKRRKEEKASIQTIPGDSKEAFSAGDVREERLF